MVESAEEGSAKSTLKEYSAQEIESRIVKYFLDILILIELNNHSSLSGYNIIESVRRKFKQSISPGTVYSVLYAIERKDLVKGESDGRKTVYTLTKKGKEAVKDLKNSKNEILEFMEIFFNL